MKSRCKICGTYWNISIQQEIPRKGYECPWCSKKALHGTAIPSKANNKLILSAL